MELVLFIGIQASGKSTLYKQQFVDTHVRLNLDMLRTRHREQILFKACLDAKQPVVVDNTNVTADDRRRYIAEAKAHKFQVRAFFFDEPLETALLRNAIRTGKSRIPDAGLRDAARRLEVPSFDEGLDELWRVRIPSQGGDFIIEEFGPP